MKLNNVFLQRNNKEGKKMRKRHHLPALAAVLALTVLMCMPVMAATKVCKIGKKSYTSLSKAVEAVKNGQTIKVTKAIKTSEHVECQNGKKFTIDFGKKKYTFSSKVADQGGGYAFGIAPGTTVTMKNLNLSSGSAFIVGGTLNILSGSMSSGYIQVRNDGAGPGALNIKGGTFNIKKEADEGPWIENFGILKISKGTFKGAADLRNQNKTTITGGSFSYSGGHSILSNSEGTMTITGGTFKSVNDVLVENFNSGKLIIKGGTFTGTNNTLLNSNGEKASVTISGGSFAKKANNGPAMQFHTQTKISGGTFKGGLSFHNKATITGGKSTNRITAQQGSDVIIKKFTVSQGKNPPAGPPFSNAALIAMDGGKITVKGGSYISKNGTGYDVTNGGTITFGIKNWKKLFQVKQLTTTE